MWPFVIRAFKGDRHINLFLYNDDRFTAYKTAYVGLSLNILETGTLNTASLVAFSGTEYRRRNGIIILLDTFLYDYYRRECCLDYLGPRGVGLSLPRR